MWLVNYVNLICLMPISVIIGLWFLWANDGCFYMVQSRVWVWSGPDRFILFVLWSYLRVCVCMCMYVCIYVCVCVYIHMYICIYDICIYDICMVSHAYPSIYSSIYTRLYIPILWCICLANRTIYTRNYDWNLKRYEHHIINILWPAIVSRSGHTGDFLFQIPNATLESNQFSESSQSFKDPLVSWSLGPLVVKS